MPFFEEVDSDGIVEQHIQSVLRLEQDQALQILSEYRGIRQQLIDRLSHIPAGTFTSQHLRGVLAQVEGATIAITESLGGAMRDGAEIAARAGVDDLVTELQKFDGMFTGAVTPININAALIAHDTSTLLVSKYQTNLDLYGQGLLTQISNGLFSASLGEASYSEVVGRISQFFTAEEWKLHRIVRTELHGIYNRGKLAGMTDLVEDDIPDLKKTLMHPMDSRTGDDSIYAAQLGLVAEVNEPFVYSWGKKERVFFAPPDRPNDRAIMVPYREEWGNTGKGAFVPLTQKASVASWPKSVSKFLWGASELI
jgi:hypothetical protein